MSRKQVFDADIFVQSIPVKTLASPDNAPGGAFLVRGMQQARIPSQGNGEAAPVIKINGKGVFCGACTPHCGDFEFNS